MSPFHLYFWRCISWLLFSMLYFRSRSDNYRDSSIQYFLLYFSIMPNAYFILYFQLPPFTCRVFHPVSSPLDHLSWRHHPIHVSTPFMPFCVTDITIPLYLSSVIPFHSALLTVVLLHLLRIIECAPFCTRVVLPYPLPSFHRIHILSPLAFCRSKYVIYPQRVHSQTNVLCSGQLKTYFEYIK